MSSNSTSPTSKFSCFISYSSGDQAFAERLHADLQSNGVTCWFAPQNLKIGDRFRATIDRAISDHDKLLLILSKHSIDSEWVGSEVEAAFEKERLLKKAGQLHPTVLFPITLDDAIWNTDEAWAADIRRTRHIGDFRQSANPAEYQKSLSRLLRDLQP